MDADQSLSRSSVEHVQTAGAISTSAPGPGLQPSNNGPLATSFGETSDLVNGVLRSDVRLFSLSFLRDHTDSKVDRVEYAADTAETKHRLCS